MTKWFSGLVVVFVLIQLVPYGHTWTNPPAVAEPNWDSPITRELAKRACFDCHSNATAWPAYARVAPASWLVRHDVDEGRELLNFSEWDRPHPKAAKAMDEIREGEMPPLPYRLMHRMARLSGPEQAALIEGLEKTLRIAP